MSTPNKNTMEDIITAKRITQYNTMCIVGLVSIIFLVILWNGWISTTQEVPRSLEIMALTFPQLICLFGVLRRYYRPHVFATFSAIFFFLLGFWYCTEPAEAVYGYILVLFSLIQFIGGYYFARLTMIRDKKERAALQIQKENDTLKHDKK